jgi:hypothetical protein
MGVTQMNVTWNQVTRYFAATAANMNKAPLPTIKNGRHAGRVDLNALRAQQEAGRA